MTSMCIILTACLIFTEQGVRVYVNTVFVASGTECTFVLLVSGRNVPFVFVRACVCMLVSGQILSHPYGPFAGCVVSTWERVEVSGRDSEAAGAPRVRQGLHRPIRKAALLLLLLASRPRLLERTGEHGAQSKAVQRGEARSGTDRTKDAVLFSMTHSHQQPLGLPVACCGCLPVEVGCGA